MNSILTPAIVFFATLLTTTSFSVAQTTRTTMQNGDWYNPMTWDCYCIPATGDKIVVNHNVILDYDYTNNGSTVVINSTGSLTESAPGRIFAQYSGSLTNNALTTISTLAVFGGNVLNKDSLNVKVLYNNAVVNNGGTIFNVDSFSTERALYNSLNGKIYATLLYNTDSISNSGFIQASQHTNTSAFVNSGQLVFTDFHNTGIFSNASSATVSVGHDFLNDDNAVGFAVLENNGYFETGHHWMNVDSVKGSGSFCISDSTANTGVMAGTFDFCDQTPPVSAPYINYNSGTISGGITYCLFPCTVNIAEKDPRLDGASLFPNPANELVLCKWNLSKEATVRVEIIDIDGREVATILNAYQLPGLHQTVLNTSTLSPGIYFVRIQTGQSLNVLKLAIAK